MDTLSIPVKQLDPFVSVPAYAHVGDAGMDLHSTCAVTIHPFERKLIPCGCALAIPDGFAALILPRSGLALKCGISVANTPGLIDSNYRGEIKVILINLDPHTPFEVKRNDRIAQLVILKTPPVSFDIVSDLSSTSRGAQGFGSSGLKS